MDTPLITWIAVVALITVIGLYKAVRFIVSNHWNRTAPRHLHVISKGTEREEFFVPGDALYQYGGDD